ncbi:uncharacterized protein LOC111053927 [Nilaparvata lugens]|uniref:uncharacterized protein LOC111053927 n=1 Tax=Nilaparvata lugens TaxID=108931 RepID=UPI00193E37F0|nr:uncharacterized protein LOC111053927 [Nilaparvata lugens]
MNDEMKFLRVVNELKVKPDLPVAHIYHYDGVIIHKSGGVRIKETKYYYNNIHKYTLIKLLDSLLELNKDVQLDKNEDQVINYFLDTKSLNYINPNTDGEGTFEIDSTWERTIRNDDDSIRVSCSKEENAGLSFTIDTDIFTMNSNDVKKSNRWQKMEILSTIVEYTAQEVSQCMKNKTLIFYKVVKKMIMRDAFKPRRIYYPAGVSVETIVFPNKKAALQITQVKFLDPKTKGLVNYVGKLAEAENIVEKLFRMNSESKKEQSKVLQSDAKSTNKNWPLDTLRYFALTNSASLEYIGDKVTYSKRRFNTWIVNTGLKILQIGTPWEAELSTTHGEMKCLLDEYNTKLRNTEIYFPKVVEYIDDKLYELDEVGFHSNFAINKTEVWICTNEMNTFIRVVSFLEMKKPIYAIRYADGVSVNIRKNSDGIEVVQIKEIIYLSASTSKALKYDGNLKIVKPPAMTSMPMPKKGAVTTKKRNKVISAVLQCFGVNTGN